MVESFSYLPASVPEPLKVVRSGSPMGKIWKLRETEYGKRYPGVTNFNNDKYDKHACILYSENDLGEITSTGRMVLDSNSGLPADELIRSEVDRLRSTGRKVAEPSKFVIAQEAKGILPLYLKTYYHLARQYGVNSLIFITRDKNVRFYNRSVGAKLVLADIGYSYGTDYRFSLLEWDIDSTHPESMQA